MESSSTCWSWHTCLCTWVKNSIYRALNTCKTAAWGRFEAFIAYHCSIWREATNFTGLTSGTATCHIIRGLSRFTRFDWYASSGCPTSSYRKWQMNTEWREETWIYKGLGITSQGAVILLWTLLASPSIISNLWWISSSRTISPIL